MATRTLAALTMAGTLSLMAGPASAKWTNPLAGRWGTGPFARIQAVKNLQQQKGAHPALKAAYERAAKPERRRATFKRIFGSAKALVAGTGGYFTYLTVLGASTPIAVGAGSVVTTIFGAATLKDFVQGSRSARRAKQNGLEAMYLAAKADPELAKGLDAGTIKYFDYHLGQKSKRMGSQILHLQGTKAQLDAALSSSNLMLPAPR